MVKEQLTDAMIDGGEALTRTLDDSGLSVTTALWLFAPDGNEWQLLIGSPEVGTAGPREVYKKIQLAINRLGEEASTVPLSVVSLLDPGSELTSLLKATIATGPGLSRIRFSKNIVGGHFVEDALIYRAA